MLDGVHDGFHVDEGQTYAELERRGRKSQKVWRVVECKINCKGFHELISPLSEISTQVFPRVVSFVHNPQDTSQLSLGLRRKAFYKLQTFPHWSHLRITTTAFG